eukprot:jgi/Picre1/33938/NNA_001416.t1
MQGGSMLPCIANTVLDRKERNRAAAARYRKKQKSEVQLLKQQLQALVQSQEQQTVSNPYPISSFDHSDFLCDAVGGDNMLPFETFNMTAYDGHTMEASQGDSMPGNTPRAKGCVAGICPQPLEDSLLPCSTDQGRCIANTVLDRKERNRAAAARYRKKQKSEVQLLKQQLQALVQSQEQQTVSNPYPISSFDHSDFLCDAVGGDNMLPFETFNMTAYDGHTMEASQGDSMPGNTPRAKGCVAGICPQPLEDSLLPCSTDQGRCIANTVLDRKERNRAAAARYRKKQKSEVQLLKQQLQALVQSQEQQTVSNPYPISSFDHSDFLCDAVGGDNMLPFETFNMTAYDGHTMEASQGDSMPGNTPRAKGCVAGICPQPLEDSLLPCSTDQGRCIANTVLDRKERNRAAAARYRKKQKSEVQLLKQQLQALVQSQEQQTVSNPYPISSFDHSDFLCDAVGGEDAARIA